MAKKLKTFVTMSGFFDLAVAAPSMKAALQIWGLTSNAFQRGFAKETDDPGIVKATLEHPGVVLRRPVGTKAAFTEQAAAPKLADLLKGEKKGPAPLSVKKKAAAKPPAKKKADPEAGRKAAQLYDLAQKRREREEQRAEAERERERAKRERATERAQAALDAAKAKHDDRLAKLQDEREAVDRKIRSEKERWQEEKSDLEAAVKGARE